MMLNKYININLFINRKSYCKQKKIKFPKVSNSKSLLKLTRSSCPIHIYDPQIDGHECACSALALLKIFWYYSINDIPWPVIVYLSTLLWRICGIWIVNLACWSNFN